VIGAFVQTLAGYQPKTVEHKLCAVRSLLRFAAADGLTDRGVLDTVPAARSSRQARIPSVWDPADVTKIIEAIDRGNPSGKRDYAIVLLICRLGVRGVDVKRLRFADLCQGSWKFPRCDHGNSPPWERVESAGRMALMASRWARIR
jgi:integrase